MQTPWELFVRYAEGSGYVDTSIQLLPSHTSCLFYVSRQVVETGHPAALEYLLGAGGDANLADREGLAPLHIAARLGDVEAAIMLLERDAIIDAVEKVPTITASSTVCLSVPPATLVGSFTILTSCPHLQNGYSALHLATQEGHDDFVEFLLKDGADIDVKDGEGR